MTGDQDFILKLLAIVLPFLGTVVVAVLQVISMGRAKKLARSVNGLKDELVAAARAEGLAQGGKDEADVGAARAVQVAKGDG